jgi:Ca-activated chloride channel family protein
MKKILFGFLGFLVLVSALIVTGCVVNPGDSDGNNKEKVDDWVYVPNYFDSDAMPSSFSTAKMAAAPTGGAMVAEESIGFSTGGAKDVGNFRENIKQGYLPLPTDLTYEGLFYDYFFDTGKSEECDKLFCPSYSYAVSKDPFSSNDDYYLAVGLNSGMKESDFKRKKLNLVVVLDISGSMSSPFDNYYYDQFGNQQNLKVPSLEESNKSKMEVAREAVVGLLGHLNDEDRFGMVLFDDIAYLGKPLSSIGNTDVESLKKHILELEPMNSTNMEEGMKMGTDLFKEYLNADQDEYENRIIFLTDAMPNTGDSSDEGLFGMFEKNSKNKLYTTFIGMGVDFNTELIEIITKIRGANYYSVHTADEFLKRMDDEFEYMVTPLVFNLRLILDAKGYEIEKVYGSPEASEATGELMKVNTLFPSKTEGGETRGGIVLLKLKKTAEDGNLNLSTVYEDRNGKSGSDIVEIALGEVGFEFYENSGIRKGILLARYADLMKSWMVDERKGQRQTENDRVVPFDEPSPMMPCITFERGIVPRCGFFELGEWERQSMDLKVSAHYKELFEKFKTYFEKEMEAIGDKTLTKEIEILNLLINKR